MIEQWFELYADDVYSFLAYMVKDTELAKDLTQETFIRAMQGMSKFRQASSPTTWLYTIARNVALSHLHKWRREVTMDESMFARLVSQFDSPENVAERSDTRAQLIHLLQRLKPGYRDVIICREVMGMSSEETAKVLGWTANRVRVTLHRALKAAKKKLTGGGWEHELA